MGKEEEEERGEGGGGGGRGRRGRGRAAEEGSAAGIARLVKRLKLSNVVIEAEGFQTYVLGAGWKGHEDCEERGCCSGECDSIRQSGRSDTDSDDFG